MVTVTLKAVTVTLVTIVQCRLWRQVWWRRQVATGEHVFGLGLLCSIQCSWSRRASWDTRSRGGAWFRRGRVFAAILRVYNFSWCKHFLIIFIWTEIASGSVFLKAVLWIIWCSWSTDEACWRRRGRVFSCLSTSVPWSWMLNLLLYKLNISRHQTRSLASPGENRLSFPRLFAWTVSLGWGSLPPKICKYLM